MDDASDALGEKDRDFWFDTRNQTRETLEVQGDFVSLYRAVKK
jgi:hypothetical protein